MGNPKLSNADRAAIILLAVGEDSAAQIMAHLLPDEVRRIGGAMSRLGRVEQEVVDEVVEDFQAMLDGPERGGLVGNTTAARRLLAKAKRGDDPEGLEPDPDFASTALSEALSHAEPKLIARYMREEHPQTAAVLLAHLNPASASAVLKLLPMASQPEIIQRLARLGGVEPEVLQELEETVRRELTLARHATQRKALGGSDKVAAILSQMNKGTGDQLLDDLEGRDPDMAGQVRERLFQFQDLLRIDDRGIQELLKQVPATTLKTALRQAPTAVAELIFKNLSQRAAAMLRDDIAAEKSRKIPVSEVEAAQREIARLARSLAEAGKIQVQGQGETYV